MIEVSLLSLPIPPKLQFIIFIFNFFIFLLLNELYYIYSCTTIITTQFEVAPKAYGGSRVRGLIGATVASHSQIRATSVTYTTARGNTGSLTY